jgi:hypothetical protein
MPPMGEKEAITTIIKYAAPDGQLRLAIAEEFIVGELGRTALEDTGGILGLQIKLPDFDPLSDRMTLRPDVRHARSPHVE